MNPTKSEFEVTRFEPSMNATWDEIVNRAENGTLLHRRAFCTHHEYKFDELSFVVTRNNEPFGIVAGNVITNASGGLDYWSHGFLTYGGLVRVPSSATTVLPAMAGVRDRLIEEGFSKFVYKPVPWVFHRRPDESDVHALWSLGAYPIRRDLSSVATLPLLSGKVAHGRRSQAKKALRSGLVVTQTSNARAFHEVLTHRLATRHKVTPAHSVADLDVLLQRFPDEIRIFGCGASGEIGAGALVFDCGNAIHLQYLTGTDDGFAAGAMDLLISHVSDLYAESASFVSFGISTEGGCASVNPGLLDYKESWGATAVTFDRWELPLTPSP
jgi:hypothetical protein